MNKLKTFPIFLILYLGLMFSLVSALSCSELGGILVHPDVCGGEVFQSKEDRAGVACCEYNTCGDGVCQEGEERCVQDCGPTCSELGGILVHPDVCGER